MSYESAALALMFGAGPVDLDKHGLQLRKGKTFADIAYARKKAYRNGNAKTETEIGIFEVYLAQVLKPTKGKP